MCLCSITAGCGIDERSIRIAVSTEEPAPSIAEVVQSTLEAGGIDATIITTASVGEVAAGIRNGSLEVAIIEEPSEPLSGLTTLVPLYPSVLHIAHNRPSDSVNFEDLIRGANVYAGPVGGAAYQLLMQLAEDFSIDSNEFQVLGNPWTITPDVYFIFGGLLSQASTDQLDGYRLFSFATEGDAAGSTIADSIALRHHHLRPFVLPRGIYGRFNDAPVLTLSIRSILVTSDMLDPEVAYDVASILFANAQEISLVYPLVTRDLNESVQPAELMLPLHESTRRYLDRDRPGFIERNAEVIALYFTILITVLSGLYAWQKRRMQIKKDRVDAYLAILLDVRTQLNSAGVDLEACRQRVLEVQNRVVGLLIEERITADSTLLAFFSQSNQLLNEIDRNRH